MPTSLRLTAAWTPVAADWLFGSNVEGAAATAATAQTATVNPRMIRDVRLARGLSRETAINRAPTLYREFAPDRYSDDANPGRFLFFAGEKRPAPLMVPSQ
jgi:hypothetical protein